MNPTKSPKLLMNIVLCPNLVASCITSQPSPLIYMTSELANQLIPSSSKRKVKSMERNFLSGGKIIGDLTIKLSDGSKKIMTEARINRLSLQPKQEQKIESQALIRRARTQERIFHELLIIFSSGSIFDPILKRAHWRITRVIPNLDMRSYKVLWVIDNDADVFLHKV